MAGPIVDRRARPLAGNRAHAPAAGRPGGAQGTCAGDQGRPSLRAGRRRQVFSCSLALAGCAPTTRLLTLRTAHCAQGQVAGASSPGSATAAAAAAAEQLKQVKAALADYAKGRQAAVATLERLAEDGPSAAACLALAKVRVRQAVDAAVAEVSSLPHPC